MSNDESQSRINLTSSAFFNLEYRLTKQKGTGRTYGRRWPKYLNGNDLVRLGLTNRWFHHLSNEDGIWKYAFLRDLNVPSPLHVSFPWEQFYASAFDGSHSYSFRQKEKHIDRMRIGAFFFDSPVVLLSETLALPKMLPRPQDDDPAKTIQSTGACLLTNARSGIWIAGKPMLHHDLDLVLLSFLCNSSNGGLRFATGSLPCVQP